MHAIGAVLFLCNGTQSFNNTWAKGNMSIALIFNIYEWLKRFKGERTSDHLRLGQSSV
jgi:hypothetical protein